jgi:hypothetical protein
VQANSKRRGGRRGSKRGKTASEGSTARATGPTLTLQLPSRAVSAGATTAATGTPRQRAIMRFIMGRVFRRGGPAVTQPGAATPPTLPSPEATLGTSDFKEDTQRSDLGLQLPQSASATAWAVKSSPGGPAIEGEAIESQGRATCPGLSQHSQSSGRFLPHALSNSSTVRLESSSCAGSDRIICRLGGKVVSSMPSVPLPSGTASEDELAPGHSWMFHDSSVDGGQCSDVEDGARQQMPEEATPLAQVPSTRLAARVDMMRPDMLPIVHETIPVSVQLAGSVDAAGVQLAEDCASALQRKQAALEAIGTGHGGMDRARADAYQAARRTLPDEAAAHHRGAVTGSRQVHLEAGSLESVSGTGDRAGRSATVSSPFSLAGEGGVMIARLAASDDTATGSRVGGEVSPQSQLAMRENALLPEPGSHRLTGSSTGEHSLPEVEAPLVRLSACADPLEHPEPRLVDTSGRAEGVSTWKLSSHDMPSHDARVSTAEDVRATVSNGADPDLMAGDTARGDMGEGHRKLVGKMQQVKDKVRRGERRARQAIVRQLGGDKEEDQSQGGTRVCLLQSKGSDLASGKDSKMVGGTNAPFQGVALPKVDLEWGRCSTLMGQEHRSLGHMDQVDDSNERHVAPVRGASEPPGVPSFQQPAEGTEDDVWKEAEAAARIATFRKKEQGHQLPTGSYVLRPDGKYVHGPSPAK